jgi:hypothetical protein
MTKLRNMLLLAAAGAICVPLAIGQESTNSTASDTTKPKYTINQRKDNQQQRVGEGVENGSLTAGEAARIEKQESHLNAEEKKMKSDGHLSAAERARIQNQQNHLSKEIYNQKHDAQTQNLNPKSEVGQRQRNQQKRIGEGVENGSLTAREASHMERREAGVNKEVAGMRQANGGTLTPGEKKLVNHQQNQDSKAIYHKKHNGRRRG